MGQRSEGRAHEGRHDVRRRVVAHLRGFASRRRLADELALAESTVRRWAALPVECPKLGRPTKSASARQMTAVRSHILAIAAQASVRDLRQRFPSTPRRWLENELRRVRADLRCARREDQAVLHWHAPGTVWAADFTMLGGVRGDSALLIRDLASGKVLHAGVSDSQQAEVVVMAMSRLIRQHGAPLVIKVDNGSAFVADQTVDLLGRYPIAVLYSPPATPAYNGACERSVGLVKAAAADLEVVWPGQSLDDRLQAGAALLARRQGRRRASPEELWARRELITDPLRDDFLMCWCQHELMERESQGIASDAELQHAQQASIGRKAIPNALCELHLLTIHRR